MTATPALVVVLWLLWGSTFVGIKLGLEKSTPDAFAVLRVAVAATVLGTILSLARWRRPHEWRPAPGLHRAALLLGVVQISGFFIFQNVGMVEAGAGLASVLLYTQPFLVAIAARVLLSEPLAFRKVVGLLLGWGGVLALVVGELEGGQASMLSMSFVLLAAVCWAIGTMGFKLLPGDFPAWRLLFWMNIYGVGPMVAFSLLIDTSVAWGPQVLVAAIWTGAAAGVGGIGLQFLLLRRGEASVVSTWMFAVPVISTAFGVALLGEELHIGLYAGAALVGLGIYLVNSTTRTRPRPQREEPR